MCSKERSPLLPVLDIRSKTEKSFCACCVRKCCLGSKAALLVLVWNFSVLLVYKELVDVKNAIMEVSYVSKSPRILVVGYSVIAVLSPLAGLLTDMKLSRHKTLLCSSYIILIKLGLVLLMASGLGALWFSHQCLMKGLGPSSKKRHTKACPTIGGPWFPTGLSAKKVSRGPSIFCCSKVRYRTPIAFSVLWE